jgi:hypothetical protein
MVAVFAYSGVAKTAAASAVELSPLVSCTVIIETLLIALVPLFFELPLAFRSTFAASSSAFSRSWCFRIFNTRQNTQVVRKMTASGIETARATVMLTPPVVGCDGST